MKVLLMNPPMKEEELFTKNSKEAASRVPPLGLGYLASCLERAGHEVKIWDGFIEKDSWDKICELSGKYDLLGIHVLTSFSLRAYEFAKFLKKKYPNKPIVLGGCHVSALPLEAMKKNWIDYVIVGEGELALTELCNVLEKRNGDLTDVLGIYYRKNNQVKFNGPRPIISNLNVLPFPARHLFNMKLYETSKARKSSNKTDMTLLTSRGCPYSCSYCSKDVTGQKIRNFSIPRIISEIKHIINKYNVEEIAIWDETFTLQRNRVIKFCKSLKKESIDITWACSSRINLVDEGLLKIMKKHGCSLIAYGIESGNDEILKKIGKGFVKSEVRKTIQMTKNVGIPIRGYFIIGLWSDTKETIMDTIRFAKELDPDIATFTMMCPLPNTLDYERACQQKNFTKEYWNLYMFPEFNFLENPIYVPESMTKEELITLHKKAYHVFYFRPKFLLHQFFSIRSIKDIKRLLAGAKTILKL